MYVSQNIKSRNDFIDPDLTNELVSKIGKTEPLEFLPINVSDQNLPLTNGKFQTRSYTLVLFGIFPNGQRAIVLIDDIVPYFTVEVPIGKSPADIRSEIMQEMMNKPRFKITDLDFEEFKARPLIGYHLEKRYVKISSPKLAIRNATITAARSLGYSTFHDDSMFYYRVFARDNQKSICSWVTISNYEVTRLDDFFKEPVFRVKSQNYTNISDDIINKTPHLVNDKTLVMTFDTENYTDTAKLPNPENLSDTMPIISATFHWRYDDNALYKVSCVKYPCYRFGEIKEEVKEDVEENIHDYQAVYDPSDWESLGEYNVLMNIATIIQNMKPDIIIGFNSSDFDWKWIITRMFQYSFERRVLIPDFDIVVNKEKRLLEHTIQMMDEFKPSTFANNTFYNGYKLRGISWAAFRNKKLRGRKIIQDGKEVTHIEDPVVNDYLTEICPIYQKMIIKLTADTNVIEYAMQTTSCMSIDVRTVCRQAFPTSDKTSLSYYLELMNLKGKEDMPIARLFGIIERMDKMYAEWFTRKFTQDEVNAFFLLQAEFDDAIRYCVTDAYRCQQLLLKLNVIQDRRAKCQISFTSLADGVFRADGMKVQNLVYACAAEKNYQVSSRAPNRENMGKYGGALVLDPIKGLHINKPNIEERIRKAENYQNQDKGSRQNSLLKPPHTEWLEVKNNDDFIRLFKDIIYKDSLSGHPSIVTNSDEKTVSRVISLFEEAKFTLSENHIKAIVEFASERMGRPVTGLDFSSLYPSIIMAKNLSPEKIISLDTHGSVDMMNLCIMDAIGNNHPLIDHTYDYSGQKHKAYFVWHGDKTAKPNDNYGLFPRILYDLKKKRSIMKAPKEAYETLMEQNAKCDEQNLTNYTMADELDIPFYIHQHYRSIVVHGIRDIYNKDKINTGNSFVDKVIINGVDAQNVINRERNEKGISTRVDDDIFWMACRQKYYNDGTIVLLNTLGLYQYSNKQEIVERLKLTCVLSIECRHELLKIGRNQNLVDERKIIETTKHLFKPKYYLMRSKNWKTSFEAFHNNHFDYVEPLKAIYKEILNKHNTNECKYKQTKDVKDCTLYAEKNNDLNVDITNLVIITHYKGELKEHHDKGCPLKDKEDGTIYDCSLVSLKNEPIEQYAHIMPYFSYNEIYELVCELHETEPKLTEQYDSLKENPKQLQLKQLYNLPKEKPKRLLLVQQSYDTETNRVELSQSHETETKQVASFQLHERRPSKSESCERKPIIVDPCKLQKTQNESEYIEQSRKAWSYTEIAQYLRRTTIGSSSLRCAQHLSSQQQYQNEIMELNEYIDNHVILKECIIYTSDAYKKFLHQNGIRNNDLKRLAELSSQEFDESVVCPSIEQMLIQSRANNDCIQNEKKDPIGHQNNRDEILQKLQELPSNEITRTEVDSFIKTILDNSNKLSYQQYAEIFQKLRKIPLLKSKRGEVALLIKELLIQIDENYLEYELIMYVSNLSQIRKIIKYIEPNREKFQKRYEPFTYQRLEELAFMYIHRDMRLVQIEELVRHNIAKEYDQLFDYSEHAKQMLARIKKQFSLFAEIIWMKYKIDLDFDVQGINSISYKPEYSTMDNNEVRSILLKDINKFLHTQEHKLRRLKETLSEGKRELNEEEKKREENEIDVKINSEIACMYLLGKDDHYITPEEIITKFRYYDAAQKALKVYMNTFYGEAGNKRSPIFALPVSATTTSTGQDLLQSVKKYIEEKYGVIVNYGDTDSVYPALGHHEFMLLDAWYYSDRIIPPIPTDFIKRKRFLDNYFSSLDGLEKSKKFHIEELQEVYNLIEEHIDHISCDETQIYQCHKCETSFNDIKYDKELESHFCKLCKEESNRDVLEGIFSEMIRIKDKPLLKNIQKLLDKVQTYRVSGYTKEDMGKMAEIYVEHKMYESVVQKYLIDVSQNKERYCSYMVELTMYRLGVNSGRNEGYGIAESVNKYLLEKTIVDLVPAPIKYELCFKNGVVCSGCELCGGTRLRRDESGNFVRKPEYSPENVRKFKSHLKIAYEEVIYPVVMASKKKYFGTAHIGIPNFKPKKLFIRGLETVKRGVSRGLKILINDLLWKTVNLDNLSEILELAYNVIDDYYNDKFKLSIEDYTITKTYKPVSKAERDRGKGNPTILPFVERMVSEGYVIKPLEKISYVHVKSPDVKYDIRGNQHKVKVSEKIELLEVFLKGGFEIDKDYYMESIASQLARLVMFYDEFTVQPTGDSPAEIKKADDASFEMAKTHLLKYASQYQVAETKYGNIYKKTYKKVIKHVYDIMDKHGLPHANDRIMCNDFNIFFKGILDNCIANATKKLQSNAQELEREILNYQTHSPQKITKAQAYKLVQEFYTEEKIKSEEQLLNMHVKCVEAAMKKGFGDIKYVFDLYIGTITNISNEINDRFVQADINKPDQYEEYYQKLNTWDIMTKHSRGLDEFLTKNNVQIFEYIESVSTHLEKYYYIILKMKAIYNGMVAKKQSKVNKSFISDSGLNLLKNEINSTFI
jgi:DNA polymerase elongation subunit (family B)